ncbi:MAG: transposase [Oscillospiraceae bacterium]
MYHVDTTIANILAQIKQLASTLKEYDIVMEMPGVGEILDPRIISEIGDATRFHSAKALVAYAGLDIPPYQSGNFISTKRSISKRDSVSLRKTGYEIMKCLKTAKPQQDSAVYDFMIKKVLDFA